MAAAVFHLRRELATHWMAIQAPFSRMRKEAQVKPPGPDDAFSVHPVDDVTFRIDVQPVAFFLPEKPSHGQPDLYVVMSGSLTVIRDESAYPTNWLTTSYATRVGYFKVRSGRQENTLRHVFGVHYDHDEELPGHPVFHSQMSSQRQLVGGLTSHFRLPSQITDDIPTWLLGYVRIPTAQMDPFSVITQLGADHLCGDGRDAANRELTKLRAACDFVRGRADSLPFLNDGIAPQCYRSTHWYTRS